MSFKEGGPLRFNLPGPSREQCFDLFVTEGASDEHASECYDRFMKTPGVSDTLQAIVMTAKVFHFVFAGVSYGPVVQPILRLYAARPECTTMGFNVVNDRALWINISTFFVGACSDSRTIVARLVSTAMHELAHACTPGQEHGVVWKVAQCFANQKYFDVCTSAGLLNKIWHPQYAC